MLNADARAIPLTDRSVHCVVTSPPYWGLRDYGIAGQLGLERTPEEYVAALVAVFREVWRVLRDDGTLWLNLGDAYAGSWGEQSRGGTSQLATRSVSAQQILAMPKRVNTGSKDHASVKPKDLIGLPWMVAFALRADGWYLRSDIIWSKPNAMPESVTDRPTKAHEYLFLLAKRERYYYDAEAIREKFADERNGDPGPAHSKYDAAGISRGYLDRRFTAPMTTGRNKRNVWEIATQPYPEAHFATFPEALVEPCIKAGTSDRGACARCGAPWARVVEMVDTGKRQKMADGWATHDGGHGSFHRDGRETGEAGKPVRAAVTTGWQPGCACAASTRQPLVLDPFAGSGTVGLVCQRLGRRSVGLELKPEYCAMSYRRTAQMGLV